MTDFSNKIEPQWSVFRCRKMGGPMQKPPLNPPVAELAPFAERLTAYDKEHLITYLRLLDADAAGIDWAEASRVIVHIDPDREPNRARRGYHSHLKRSKWMTEFGYRYLLQ
jgi:hypothetical protein